MGLTQRLTEQLRSWWTGPINSSDPALGRFFSGSSSSTGIPITEQSALTYSAVWAAVSLISSDVGSLPLFLYKRLPNGGKERFTNHKLFGLLHDEPNPEMSSMIFRETMQAHVLTWGNAYAEIVRSGDGRPAALWPIVPDRVTVRRVNGQIVYFVSRQDGGADPIPAADVLHIAGLGYDGLIGYSVIAKARESIGLGLATERFGGSFFGNGSTFGGVLSHPQNLTTEVKDAIRESIQKDHGGVGQAHKFIILGGGTTYTKLGIPPNDAQFLETRQFQINEIARWFRVPPHKLADLDRSTNNNIEHQGIEYYTDTLRPWLVRWEQEINRKLISPSERRIQYAEHLIEGVLRGDMASRYAAYAVGRQWGWLCPDDICEMENRNPLPNGAGKLFLVPLNMAPADKLTPLIDAQIEKTKMPPAAPQAPQGPDTGDPKDTGGADAARALEAILAALADVEERAGVSTARVAELEAEASRSKADAAAVRVELEEARAIGAAATAEWTALKALQLEATERLAREEAARAAQQVADEAARATLAADAATARALAEDATAHAAQAEAERLTVEAELVAVRLGSTDAERQRAETAAALTAERAAAQQQRLAVIGAHRALIADAMGRMIRRETEKARRAQTSPAKLLAWMDGFYPLHAEACRAALLPAMRAHLAWLQSPADPDAVTQAFVQTYIAESIRQLHGVLEQQDVAAPLELTLRRWEQERAEASAELVLRDALAHVAG